MSSNAATWSATANAYASQIAKATGDAGESLLELTDSLNPITENSVVLDTGTGTGELTARTLARCPKASITATDIAPGMLAVVKKRNLPVETQILNATQDYVAQGLREEQFTHVLSSFMHQFVAPVQRTVTETYRVLEPGGIIGVAIWTKNEAVDPWNIACKNLDPSFEPTPFPPGLFEWRTTEDMEEACIAAGFVDCKSTMTELYLVFDSAEQYAEAFLTAKNPAWLMAQKAWKGAIEDVKDELVKVIREHFRDGKIFLEAGFTAARKPTA